MRKRVSRLRPQPATVISLIALFISLSGIAYAAALPKNSVGSKQIKKNAVIKAKIRAGAVDSRTILDGSIEPTDLSASAKTSGPTGPAGIDGSARAYAMVNRVGPALDESRSKGITSVTSPLTGKYCLTVSASTGIDLTKTAPVVTPTYFESSINGGTAQVDTRSTACGAGAFAVYTYTSDSSPASTDFLSFNVVVP